MVFKIIANVYIGDRNEINNPAIKKYDIIDTICISSNKYNQFSYQLSFGKSDQEFYQTLDQCLILIQKAKIENNNILICCDNGSTETLPIIIYYLIICLNMNISDAENYVNNCFINNDKMIDNKYVKKLHSKYIVKRIFENYNPDCSNIIY